MATTYGAFDSISGYTRAHPDIVIGLCVIGIAALLAMWAVIFLPSAAEDMDITTTVPLEVGTPAFVNAIAGVTHSQVLVGNSPTILNNGDEFMPAVVASIAQAKHTVNITNYIWVKGTFSDTLFAALIAAQKRGVQVRILADADGSTSLPQDQIDQLRAAGGQFETYHPISLHTLSVQNRRDHRRAVVIDGTDAYTGGIAIKDEWLGNGLAHGHWRDMMFEFHGAMAQSMQNIFADIWQETTGEVIAGDGFYPLSPTATTGGSATMLQIDSVPTSQFQPIRDALYLSIISAKKNIYITNPYLLPDAKTMRALEDKARSGVDVRILTAGPDTDAPFVEAAGEANFNSLLTAGVKIYQYNTRVHTKTMVVDDVWTLVGSANFDSRSSGLNIENVIGITDPKFATTMQQMFSADITHAHEVTVEEWKHRSFFNSVRSWFFSLLAKQM
jgi:cardiolipin synthase